MEEYTRIIEIVDANLILCLIPILLTLRFVEYLFQNRFETKKALNVVRWTILLYALVTWTVTLIGIIRNPEETAFLNRAVGPYATAYWIMLLLALVVPLTLFSKRLGTTFWYLLIAAFCLKFGTYFERFVLLVTSFHRDYLTENGDFGLIRPFVFGMGVFLLQGILIALLMLVLLEILKPRKPVQK